MLSKAAIKDIRALHLPKFRQSYNKFIAEGDKVCIELLKRPKYNIEKAFICTSAVDKYLYITEEMTVEIFPVSVKEMEQLSAFKTPSDILLLVEKKEDDDKILLNSHTSAIYLDGLQDPGNVGTIIRIADWFGIDAVIRSTGCVDFFNPKVIQASMGSIVNVSLCTMEAAELPRFGKEIMGTFMHGENIFAADLPDDAIMVLGSEGQGISPSVEKMIRKRIAIPGSEDKVAESLNVAVAAGIMCGVWKGK
jgi:TrmH family RNA methyltransferase